MKPLQKCLHIYSTDVQTNRANVLTPTMEDGFYWLSKPLGFAGKQQDCSVTYRLAYVALSDMWSPELIRGVTVQSHGTHRQTGPYYTGRQCTKRGMHIPCIPVPLYNKVKKNKILKKKSQLALPTNSCSSLRNPNPVEFPLVVREHHHPSSGVFPCAVPYAKQAWWCSYLSSLGCGWMPSSFITSQLSCR